MTTTLNVTNPATGETSGSVETVNEAAVAAAVASARTAQSAWNAQSFRARARVMKQFHDLLFAHRERILDTIQSESGKARKDALNELVTVAGTARYYIAHGNKCLRVHRRRGALPLITTAWTHRKPHGVVGLITPWNFPFLLGVADALPALLAGNAVVTKPSEVTPLSTQLARELLIEAGLPAELFQVVHGTGADAGSALMQHVDYIGFTGSERTGRIVASTAAARMIPFTLELGGKNAMIVAKGANVSQAVAGLIPGAFMNCGQTCISIERAYVHESLYDQFVESAAARIGKLKVGWSNDWSTDVGSLVSSEHADRVSAHIEDAINKGVTVVCGGKRRLDLGECFVEPTLLTGVTADMDLFEDETFGPVVAVYKVASDEEAIDLANTSNFGLNASVWAGSRRRARNIAQQIEAGTVCINSTLLIYNSFAVPMGGIRFSGYGRRHGAEGIERYTTIRSIAASVGTGGGFDNLTKIASTPRGASFLLWFIKLLRYIPGVR